MSPRTGRPKSENPKSVNLNLRITKDNADIIQECADILQTSRTEVILRGVQLVQAEIQNKK